MIKIEIVLPKENEYMTEFYRYIMDESNSKCKNLISGMMKLKNNHIVTGFLQDYVTKITWDNS